MRSDPFVAVSFAEQKATDLANGEAWRQQLGQADWSGLQRAREILATLPRTHAPTPPSIELAVSVYADSVRILPAGVSPADAARFYVEHLPAGVAPQPVPALVASLIAKKRTFGKGEKWLRTLDQQLTRFAARFTGPLHTVRAHEITAWLDSLAVGLRTRKNYRDAVRELVLFAQSESQISKTWDELDRVEDPAPPAVEVEVYTPEQLLKLLAVTRPNMIPFTVLQAFAGIRHEEMTGTKALLDWRDLNLDKGILRIKKTVGKTKKLRLVDLHANLVAWLRPHARMSGRVCELDHTANALVRAKQRAGIPAGRGQLTNALRSSFISYRLAETNDIGLVAREAGNSPNIIKENYLELVTRAEGRRWFDIWPTHAEVLQLDFGLGV
jgi:integrase